jgi:ribosome-binding factor A
MTRRTERIASQLLAELAQRLRREVGDPRVALVTLTRADVAPDLSQALVFWSALDLGEDAAPERIEACQHALESAAPLLRRAAARALPLRRMPALRFRYDPSFVLAGQTLSVLREVAPDPETADRAEAKADLEPEGDDDGAQS